jgi:outer membrane protein assembly factor BamB
MSSYRNTVRGNRVYKKIVPVMLVVLLFLSSFVGISKPQQKDDAYVEQSIETSSDGLMDSAWPMFQHDTRHTGKSPISTADNPGTEKWRFYTDHWLEAGSVINQEDVIYFADGYGYLFALNANGTEKWVFEMNGQDMGSTPALANDGTIYVGDWDDFLYAINPDGTEKWRFKTGGSISSSPAIADDGTIYFGTMRDFDKGDIFAVNSNGTEKWRYETGYYTTSDPAIADDGTIYIGSGDSYLYAMNPNGTLKWRFKTDDEIHGHPSIAEDGTIYIGSWDDYLYAINPNGTLKWRFHTGWGTSNSQAIDSDGTIYVGTDELYAIYPNGTLKWSFNAGSNKYFGKSSPAISAEGTIYIGVDISDGNGGEILAVNQNGTELWRKRIAEEWIASSPCIGADGTVYIGSSSLVDGISWGYLHAFNYFPLESDDNGPYKGVIKYPVQFTGSADGGYPPYTYRWDFGDEETSDEQNPTHIYENPGNYTVTLTVTDDKGNTTSDNTWAIIRGYNNPPEAPTIDGPTEGKIKISYPYTFLSNDPEEDDIKYFIEWGDGEETETSFYQSGDTATASHTWQTKGDYAIRAKAIDIYGAESDWATLEVTVPRNKPILNAFEQRFQLLFTLFSRFI